MTDASGQRQRAEAVYGSLTCTTYREGYQDPDNDIGIIEQALTTARWEALREARQSISRLFDENQSGTPEYYCALLDAGNELDRLAREGVR